jgi:hypothetical protein
MPTKWIKITTVVIVVFVAAGIAFAAGQRRVEKPRRALSSETTTPTTSRSSGPTTNLPSQAGGLVEFVDQNDGFAISYPRTWLRLQGNDPGVVLVVSEKPIDQNNGGSLLTRVVNIGTSVSQEQLPEAKKITDQIVTQGQGVELKFEPKAIMQGGLPGWLYVYTFADKTSGRRGIHSHYFLFKGQTMISFVFQALPDTEFARLAPAFDDMIGTFRVL